MDKDTELISSQLLQRSIENLCQKKHHENFLHMKNASEISERLEKSKEIFFRLERSLRNGIDSYDEPLRYW